MLRLIAPGAAALALLLAAQAAGQEEPDVGDILDRLDLTAESVPIVEPVVVDSVQRHYVMRRTGGDAGELRERLDRERRRARGELAGVLGEDQLAEWGRIQDELDAYVLSGARP